MSPDQFARIAECIVADYRNKWRIKDDRDLLTADSLLNNPFRYSDSEFPFVKMAAQAIIEGTDILDHSSFTDTDGNTYKTIVMYGYEIMAESYRRYSSDAVEHGGHVYYPGRTVRKVIPNGWSTLELLDDVFYNFPVFNLNAALYVEKYMLFGSFKTAAKYLKLKEFGLNICANGYIDYTDECPKFQYSDRMAYYITAGCSRCPGVLYFNSFLDTVTYADFTSSEIERNAFEVRLCRRVAN